MDTTQESVPGSASNTKHTEPRLRGRRFSPLLRRAFGVAGLGITAGVGALVILALFAGDSATKRASASVEARTLVAFAEQRKGADGASQVKVVSPLTKVQTPLGEPDNYASLAFSPDGMTIAALAASADRGRLHLFSLDGSERLVNLDSSSDALFVRWAPDGKTLAVIGAHVLLFAADGTELNDLATPAVAGSVGNIQNGGGYGWSSNSETFGAIVNGSLLLLRRDGASRSTTLRDLNAGTGEGNAVFLGWRSDSVVFGVPSGEGLSGFSVDAMASTLSAQPVPPESELPVPEGARAAEPTGAVDALKLVANGTILSDKPSADGSADIYEIARDGSSTSPPAVVIRDRRTGVPFEVTGLSPATRGGALVDAFVQSQP